MTRNDDFGLKRRTLLRTVPPAIAGIAGVGIGSASRSQSASPGDELWSYQTDARVISSPTVANGTVFIGSYDNHVYALDATSGSRRWRFETGGAVFSSPAVSGSTIYVGSSDGKVYALDSNDGTEEWSFQTGDWVDSSPTVANGTVYVGSYDDYVYALDADDGSMQWRFEMVNSVFASPSVAGGTVYITSNDDYLYALDADTGEGLWNFSTGGTSSPTIADGTVYVGGDSGYVNVYAVDADDGTEEWSFETEDGAESSPTVADGTVFIGGDAGYFYAIDADNGTEKWRFQPNGDVDSSPTVAGGNVYFGCRDSRLYAFDADAGAEEWRFEANDEIASSPTVANGIVYVGSRDGNVYAVDAGVEGSSVGSRVQLGTLGGLGSSSGSSGGISPGFFENSEAPSNVFCMKRDPFVFGDIFRCCIPFDIKKFQNPVIRDSCPLWRKTERDAHTELAHSQLITSMHWQFMVCLIITRLGYSQPISWSGVTATSGTPRGPSDEIDEPVAHRIWPAFKSGPALEPPARSGSVSRGDETMPTEDRAGLESPAPTRPESLSTCPRCAEPLTGIATRGPTDHRASPCGCRLGSSRLDDLDQERVLADGGQTINNPRERLQHFGLIGPDGDTDVLESTTVRARCKKRDARIPALVLRHLGFEDGSEAPIRYDDGQLVLRRDCENPDWTVVVSKTGQQHSSLSATMPMASLIALAAQPGDEVLWRDRGDHVVAEVEADDDAPVPTPGGDRR